MLIPAPLNCVSQLGYGLSTRQTNPFEPNGGTPRIFAVYRRLSSPSSPTMRCLKALAGSSSSGPSRTSVWERWMGCVRGVLSCFVAVLSWRLLLPFWSLLASSSCRGVLLAAQTANAGAVSLLLWFAGLYSPEESCGKGAGAADNSAPRRPRHRFPIDCGRDCSLGGSCLEGRISV